MDRYIGKRLDGRYEIQEIIGVGGMAVVYKAHDNQENRTVAVKILKPEFVSNEEFLHRFKNESKAIAMLSHPNIVKVYDVSFGDLIQYIVMEYIEGITLKEYIEQRGSLRWKDAVHFTIQILKGLQHAHDKGIVHRDVKPQNIMVLPDGTIKVTDFGIARFTRSDQRTITDKAIGSVHYISPEQAKGEKTDEKSDIYSLGVILYEMITGQMPFQAESAVSVAIMQLQREPKTPTEINGSIPMGLEQITMHAMQKTPERRYQSAAEMLCDLDAFRKDPAITFDYNYFVDDAPTKYVGTIPQNDIETNEEEEEEAPAKSSIIPILTGVAVTLVLVLVVLGIKFIPGLFNKSAEIACPNFVGKKYEEIIADDEYKNTFKFKDEWDYSSDYDFGYVFEQSEKEGEKLKKGANITLYVSMGENTKKVPNVYGKSEAAAVSELKAQGFTNIEKVEMESEDVEEGKVIKTEPKQTQVVKENEKITIYISTGKPEVKVKVPDVIGLTEESAKKKLEEEKLTVNVEKIKLTKSDKYYPVGVVSKQDPSESKTDAKEGDKVTIYVCDGYKFDLEISLPMDYTDTFNISLWKNGIRADKGQSVDSTALSTYTFKDLESETEKAVYTVKISNDGKNYYNYMKVTFDANTWRIVEDDSIADYPLANSSDDPSDSPSNVSSNSSSNISSNSSSNVNSNSSDVTSDSSSNVSPNSSSDVTSESSSNVSSNGSSDVTSDSSTDTSNAG